MSQIWTWLWEVMSCSASEAAFLFSFLLAIGSWANNPAWGASQVCSQALWRLNNDIAENVSLALSMEWKISSPERGFKRSNLFNPAEDNYWGRHDARKGSFSRFEPFFTKKKIKEGG